MTSTENFLLKQHVKQYKEQRRHILLTSRFNNSTFQENTTFRSKNPKIGCVYCSPDPISQEINIDTVLFILEMNNDTNKITGIGMVRNHPQINKYMVYNNRNYNRYVYVGKYRIDRNDMSEMEERVMKVFDHLCFKGTRHMKRGQGLKSFPVDMLYRCMRTMDLVKFISEMFKRKIDKENGE